MEQLTVLHSCYETALAARKARADEGCCFGTQVTTASAWLADRWELFGDGRVIVGSLQRQLLVSCLLVDDPELTLTSGAARSLASFVAYYAGEPLFESIVGHDAASRATTHSLSPAEDRVFSLIALYFKRLDANGLIEPGRAAALLADASLPDELIVAERLDVSPALGALVDSCTAKGRDKGVPFITADGDQRSAFAFPAGIAAVKQAVLDLVDDPLAHDDTIALYAQDPLETYGCLAPELGKRGYSVELRCSVAFSDTAFGRALDNAEAVLSGDAHWLEAATDFAHGTFSGMSAREAQKLNATLRADRFLDAASGCDLLLAASSTFRAFVAIASGGPSCEEARRDLSAFLAKALNLDPCARAIEERALEAHSRAREAAVALEVPSSLVNDLVRSMSIPVSAATSATSSGRSVVISSHDLLGRAVPGSVDGVIVEGLTDTAFVAGSGHSSFDGLAERIGLPLRPSRTESLRWAFEVARSSAREDFACIMALRDRTFEPTYPAFVLDEYVAACSKVHGWDEARSDKDLFGYPEQLACDAIFVGEDELALALGRSVGEAEGLLELEAPVRGALSHMRLVDNIKTVREGDAVLPVLSPSAIEEYLSCPYRWFLTRRVNTAELDEGFSVREMGLVAHRAYAELFDALGREGIASLTADALERASALLEDITQRILFEHASDLASGERLAAIDAQERLEAVMLKRALAESLAYLAQLPEGYSVLAQEYEIGVEDGVDFAGARIVGRIDRIDVDASHGRFAVIDYKGSLRGHEAGFGEDMDEEGFELPDKVQALIYARAFERKQGVLAAAAALYADYRASEPAAFLAGSFDPAAYDVAALAKGRSEVRFDFGSFLSLVEERVAPAVKALLAGDIAPKPKDAGACRWCAFTDCERRL